MKPTHKERMQGIGDSCVARKFPEKIPAWVRAAVVAIEMDIEDRRGLKREWQQIDQEIRQRIRPVWATVIVRAAKKQKSKD